MTSQNKPNTSGYTRRDDVKAYYGQVLKSNRDLKSSACCTADSLAGWHKEILSEIDDEIIERFYGCGSPIPPLLEGCTVLDLGCGTGRDTYVVSKLVGETGSVIGLDMTEEQLAVATRHEGRQAERFGFARSNVSFRHGYIEELQAAGIEDDSIDVVISNCVINLSPDKRRVFEEIFRVLKPGGELYFADILAGRRVPEHLTKDPVLYGECLSGAMYVEDFRRLTRDVGFLDCRVVSNRRVSLEDSEVEAKVGMIDFYSTTVRAFKLDTLEDICEDYGQIATYKGTIEHHPHRFELDDHHEFIAGKPMLVCGNTASMLSETRYGEHFDVTGDRTTLYGVFQCGSAGGEKRPGDEATGGACC